MILVDANGDSILKTKQGVVTVNNGAAFLGVKEITIDYSDLMLSDAPIVLTTLTEPSHYGANDCKTYVRNVTKTSCIICANQVNSSFGASCKISYLIIGN